MERNSGRYHVAVYPSSLFSNIPASCVPTSTNPQTTKMGATQEARVADIDQMDEFREQDSLKGDSFHARFLDKLRSHGVVACNLSSKLPLYVLLSHARKVPVFDYMIYFEIIETSESFCHLRYVAYVKLQKSVHTAVTAPIKFWSQLDELIRFVTVYSDLNNKSDSNKKIDFLNRALDLVNTPKNTPLG